MINSLLYSVYSQARARTPARHALAILYAAVAALRAPRKLIVKQAFNTVQTGHAQRCLERNLSNKTCVASLRRPPHVTVATQRRRNMHRGRGSDAHPTTRGRSALVGTMGWCWKVVVHPSHARSHSTHPFIQSCQHDGLMILYSTWSQAHNRCNTCALSSNCH